MQLTSTTRTAVLGLAVLFGATACGGGAASSSEATEEATPASSTAVAETVTLDEEAAALLPQSVKDSGELTVAMDLNYPPTTFLAEDNKTPIGLNPDIARMIGKKLGVDIKFENVSFDTIIPGIEGGRYDFTATSMTKTPERLEVLDMIDYFSAGVSVAVQKGNPEELTNEDLCGHTIAVTQGSNAQLTHLPNVSEWTCESQGKEPIEPAILPDVQEALTQLSSGRVDGILYDTPSLAWAELQQPEAFEVLTPEVDTRKDSDDVAVALKKGSDLTPAMQAAVQSILESPEYNTALANWNMSDLGIETAELN